MFIHSETLASARWRLFTSILAAGAIASMAAFSPITLAGPVEDADRIHNLIAGAPAVPPATAGSCAIGPRRRADPRTARHRPMAGIRWLLGFDARTGLFANASGSRDGTQCSDTTSNRRAGGKIECGPGRDDCDRTSETGFRHSGG